jgi:hypothetical protein
MCAMVYDRYGGPDVLCMRKVPVPEQQDGEGLDPDRLCGCQSSRLEKHVPPDLGVD